MGGILCLSPGKYLLINRVAERIPTMLIRSIEDTDCKGEFDFVIVAQSPDNTPAGADFIINICTEYIVEI